MYLKPHRQRVRLCHSDGVARKRSAITPTDQDKFAGIANVFSSCCSLTLLSGVAETGHLKLIGSRQLLLDLKLLMGNCFVAEKAGWESKWALKLMRFLF